jgi:hypothetical protein
LVPTEFFGSAVAAYAVPLNATTRANVAATSAYRIRNLLSAMVEPFLC